MRRAPLNRTSYIKSRMNHSTYTPYHSDSDTDSGSESETDTGTSSIEEGFKNNVANLPLLASALAKGFSLNDSANDIGDGTLPVDTTNTNSAKSKSADPPDLITNQYPNIGFPISSNPLPTFSNLYITPDVSGNILESSSQSVQTTIMLDSRNRDRKAFPQPTNLTLKLPAVYKNVTSFSIVQIKLLSAFYYFSATKQNITLPIHEIGRQIIGPKGALIDEVIANTLREGTYDINSLLSEITTKLNNTPIFYDFTGGFNDFATKFSVTGDTSLNFNYPGDTYYDALLQTYIPNPNMDLIISKYFSQRYANLTNYTLDNIKIAYYYPVLKETFLDISYPQNTLNLTLKTSASYLLTGETVRSRVIYTFQGLFDPVILELINSNIKSLDTYRVEHTFRFYLINKYNVSYEQQSNRVIIQSPSLNTSLVNLLNYKASQYFTEQLNYYKITEEQYNNLNALNAALFAVVNDMYRFYQQILAIYFGIPFNSFSLSYLATSSLTLPIRDGYNAQGIATNYNGSVIANTVAQIEDILLPYRKDATPYWNRMTNLPSTTIAYMSPLLPAELGILSTISLNTWNNELDDQDYVNQIVESNVLDPLNPNTSPVGNIYVNKRTGYSDILVPLEAAAYTTFRFKSPVRQTMKVETLPRPTKYRYLAYNAVTYDANHQALFDLSYAYVHISANKNMDVSSNTFNISMLQTLPGFSTIGSTSNFGCSFTSSQQFWGSTTNVISIVDPVNYYTFYTPFPTDYLSCNAPAFTYPMNVTFQHVQTTPNPNLNADIYMFLYHDRAAFMADISGNRTENPLHYVEVVSTSITTNPISTFSLNFMAYANQQYYILARSQLLSFSTEEYRLIPYFPADSNYTALTSSLVGFSPYADPTSNLTNYNYATVADPNFLRLPTASTIYSPPAEDPMVSSLMFVEGLMGYDTSNVTTDLTNYIGYVPRNALSTSVPVATVRIDPTNGYIFQARSPYNLSTQTYLFTGSSNAILGPGGANVYTPSTISYRQKSIVQWYGTTFLPPTENQPLFDTSSIAYAPATAFTAQEPVYSTLVGYTYKNLYDIYGNAYLGTSNYLMLGDGVFGIGFVPEQGVWEIDRFSFKSIFTNAVADPNQTIAYIGIFPANYTSNRAIGDLSLSTATAVLSFQSSITYNSSNQNFGFDPNGGTFYEFVRTSGSNVYGYNQNAYTYNFDINAQYVAIPFTASSNFQYFYGLIGAPVPYPNYSQVRVVDSIPTPEGPLYTPNNGQYFVPGSTIVGANPIYGPPTGYTTSQSKYEQSMAIGTTAIFYAEPYPINTNPSPFQSWTPFTYTPSEVITTCSDYILTRDSVYRIYGYSSNARVFRETYQFTLDQVFPSASNIDYLGVAANESTFAFFGFSNATPSSFIMIRTMNPRTGTIDKTRSEISPLGFQSSVQLLSVTYNNYGGYVMSARSYDSGTNTTTLSVVSRPQEGVSTLTLFSQQIVQPNIEYFTIGQSPKEAYGRFWVFPYRTGAGVQDMAYVNPNNIHDGPPAGPYMSAVNDSITTKYATVYTYALSNSVPNAYKYPCVFRDVEKDRIFLLSDTAPTNFFEAVYTVGIADADIITSAYTFPDPPTKFSAGTSGALWALIGNTLYGNRYNYVDAPKRGVPVWQLFYPVHRIVFHQISKNFSFLSNLTDLTYPEYPHTAIAIYNNTSLFTADTDRKWGLERSVNFNTADFNFQGYYFNANQFTVPLEDNRASNDYYYMTIRNYTPTEKSQVLLRVSLPNTYTFGYVTPVNLINEISTAKYVNSTNDPLYTYYWDSQYIKSLIAFNSSFVIDSNGKVFGGGVIDGYPGYTLSSISGFGDFYSTFQSLYTTFSTQVTLANTIQSAVKTNVNSFITSDLSNIIPSTALIRQRYTDPLQFSIKFQSLLSPNYTTLKEEWGLGWNLGYDKIDTDYDTIHKGESFFKILDDFISLKLNPENDMNRMDIVQDEDLFLSQETTGVKKAFFGKLLLATFGSYAQTLISNPITFLNPLGKLDRLTFQWVDAKGTILNNNECEWNAVVQISEEINITKPSKPVLINPMRSTNLP
jgi:hypothetical protein